jgi:hypothetical protein
MESSQRMTIGQLVECLVGKCAAIQGMDADGTVFEEHDFEHAKDVLEKLGYERNGYEEMYNGMSGEKMKAQIFVGPTFYQRLKHLVEDKIHCLDATHDVLTSEGWKQISKITMEDNIACLKDNIVVYEQPVNVFAYEDYEGEMYSIDSDFVKLTVTGNHRMWAKLEGDDEFNFHYARDIYGKSARYLTMNENGSMEEVDGTSDMVEKIYVDKVPVYCVEVPSEVFFVRDSITKVAVWTANSRSRGAKTSLTRRNYACLSYITRCS